MGVEFRLAIRRGLVYVGLLSVTFYSWRAQDSQGHDEEEYF